MGHHPVNFFSPQRGHGHGYGCAYAHARIGACQNRVRPLYWGSKSQNDQQVRRRFPPCRLCWQSQLALSNGGLGWRQGLQLFQSAEGAQGKLKETLESQMDRKSQGWTNTLQPLRRPSLPGRKKLTGRRPALTTIREGGADSVGNGRGKRAAVGPVGHSGSFSPSRVDGLYFGFWPLYARARTRAGACGRLRGRPSLGGKS